MLHISILHGSGVLLGKRLGLGLFKLSRGDVFYLQFVAPAGDSNAAGPFPNPTLSYPLLNLT